VSPVRAASQPEPLTAVYGVNTGKAHAVLSDIDLGSCITSLMKVLCPLHLLLLDNHLPTPWLLWHLLNINIYCPCTIRTNLFPLEAQIKQHLTPKEWESKSLSDTKKAQFRQLPANLVSFGPLTLTSCFDVGLVRMVTTLPNLDFQSQNFIRTHRRAFLDFGERSLSRICVSNN
jgi:hypothetical protein